MQTTGTPISGGRRLQFNLEMKPIEEVPYMADIQEMYYPLFWLEEGADMKAEYAGPLKTLLM